MVAESFLQSWLDSTVTLGTALLLAALGEVVAERSGVLNLGIEGMMAIGTLAGVIVADLTGNPVLGFLSAAISGLLMASIHGYLSISLKSDQVISGVMLTLFGTGLAAFLGNAIYESPPQIGGFDPIVLPVIGQYLIETPIVGPALFESAPTDYFAVLLVPITAFFLFRTRLGLEIIAVGDDPETADTMGVSVARRRYLAVLIGGLFAGMAGGHLSLVVSKFWSAGMVSGRGWIAVALVIFAQWRPIRALVGAYIFGSLESLAVRSQQLNSTLGELGMEADTLGLFNFFTHPQVMATYPYFATVIVLVLVSRRARGYFEAPSALLKPYLREAE